jgi:copper(I)-binding protein
MFRIRTALAAGIMIGAAIFAANAQNYTSGSLKVGSPWTRATPAGAKVAGGYMTITNTGKDSDRLVGGSFSRAGRFEVHEMKMDSGVMKMRELQGGLEIKPGQTVQLKPGGYHVMFLDLSEPLKQGETIKGQLRFEKAGTVDIEYKVESIGAQSSGHQGH